MSIIRHASYTLGDIVLDYQIDRETGHLGLRLYPASRRCDIVRKRKWVDDDPGLAAFPPRHRRIRANAIDSLVQMKVRGDREPSGFSQGLSMRNAAPSLRYQSQKIIRRRHSIQIRTVLKDSHGCKAIHLIHWQKGESFIQVTTTYENVSDKPLTLDMASSFSLGGLTPFHRGDASGRLFLHRFRSYWSAEGKHERIPFEDLHLERSWAGSSVRVERFGQIGSMPVKGFFPFAAVEDSVAHVFWGVQLAWAGSWQLELWRRHDDASLSGGLADRESGHWWKELSPGEKLETPKALLSVSDRSFDDLCRRLLSYQERAEFFRSASEQTLPIVFNEYCTTWGNPEQNHVLRLAKSAAEAGAGIFVIDAGWYKSRGVTWMAGHGDWQASPEFFPKGLGVLALAIRNLGLIPGLWFEFETCGERSTAFLWHRHQLHRDGTPLTVGKRRFWDFRDPWVIRYLEKRVIHFLRENQFGYIKIDYNETIGVGCDGVESPGEGLRLQILAVRKFIQQLRHSLPHLIIENCASGGHRLEPSMMELADMGSFSDAHTTLDIPIIAANLHRLIPPAKSQVWAVVNPQDLPRKLVYTLASGFLGRLCLSGHLNRLSNQQWTVIRHAAALYQSATKIIREGHSTRLGTQLSSYRHPEGWQGVWREGGDGKAALVVCHAFQKARQQRIQIPAQAPWKIVDCLSHEEKPTLQKGSLIWQPRTDFSAAVVLLKKA
ncbi:MAG: hypothetical protein B9S32_07965 [Verrucomicrobia bacterium Tous-C9LFEB]|nr:MAG: hypothetical protein B9S32_07965 [Verrucomicrobia bacterium Tous-C9LFEB]